MSSVRAIRKEQSKVPRSTLDDRFGVAPPPKRSRVPEVALGLLVMVVCALAGLWLFTRSNERMEALALARDVGRGDVLTSSDLEVVEIGSDDQLRLMGRGEAGSLVGEVAVADLGAGTLVSSSMFVPATEVVDGEGVIGLEVPVGQVPSSDLVRGDRVSVVLTPSQQDLSDAANWGVAGPVLVDAATVMEVSPIGTSSSVFVSLAMTEEQARVVAVAAAQGQVRLVKVTRG